MDATPFEQEEVVAEATYDTAPVTVEPLAGLVTVTPANAPVAQNKDRHTISFKYLRITKCLQFVYLLPKLLNYRGTTLASRRHGRGPEKWRNQQSGMAEPISGAISEINQPKTVPRIPETLYTKKPK
jgi:hypothetical protein